MAKLELEIVGYTYALKHLIINGKKCKLKECGNNTRKCEVEAEQAEVMLYQPNRYVGKYWFWWELFYYIISIFGMFDVYLDKKFVVYDFAFKVNLEQDKKVTLKISNFVDGEKFAEIENEQDVEVISNIQYCDKEAKKRYKKMKKAKFAISFLTIIAVVLCFVFIK